MSKKQTTENIQKTDKKEHTILSKISSAAKRLSPKQMGAKKIAAISVAIAILAGTAISAAARSRTANIVDGEKVVSILTFNGDDTDGVLQSAGIMYGDDDIVVSNKDSSGNLDITVYRAFDVKMIVDGEESVETFNMGNVSDALKSLSIKVDSDDIVTPDMSAELKADMTIKVDHYTTVSIKADGKTQKVKVTGTTVAQALKSAGIETAKDDIIEPAIDSELTDNLKITVKRVEYKEVTKTKEIPFETISKNSKDVYIGDVQVTQYGEKGSKEVVYKVKYVDGKKDSKEVISETVTKEPVEQIELKGQKKKQLSSGTVTQADGKLIDASGNEIAYSQLISGTCTAYTATGNLTATGEVAQVGRVAVNPNLIPYGTKMYIASPDGSVVYGYCTASDTGGALMDGYVLVDLYYDTEYECIQFGRRTMNVYILG
ncbi:MAG: ubiquitin-like domain-containing protein [Clostridiales bacterium]|nr:ubiquitin-like domain-containing protein [Clostridiales bacterium]